MRTRSRPGGEQTRVDPGLRGPELSMRMARWGAGRGVLRGRQGRTVRGCRRGGRCDEISHCGYAKPGHVSERGAEQDNFNPTSSSTHSPSTPRVDVVLLAAQIYFILHFTLQLHF